MSDFGGLGGALLLSEQISSDRLMDSYRRAREASALNASEHGWRRQYNDLVNRYNALLADANRLCQSHDAHVAVLSSTIDDEKAASKQAQAEADSLRQQLASLKFHYDTVMVVLKDRAPELYDKLNY